MKHQIFFILLLLASLPIGAQRNKKVQQIDALTKASEAMHAYDFQEAIDVLETKIATEEKKRRGKQNTDKEEELLEVARKNYLKLQATEVVTFIDSIVLSKDEMLSALQLSQESGRVVNYSDHFNQPDNQNCAVFINQMGNRELFAKPDKNKHLRLFQRERIGEQWKAPQLLTELVSDENEEINYPFLLGDGITLYFGAIREEGLGGYDIYMTRYDSDEHSYLSAENIGMPFNSPANDYMLAIDEYFQLGFLLTDRNQPSGKVCLYTFIPNDTRHIYDEETTPYNIICERARIARIADTWTDQQQVAQARQRLMQLHENKTRKETTHDFIFVVDNKRTFYHLEEFKAETQELVKQWQQHKSAYEQGRQQLDVLRQKYAYAVKESKLNLAPQILSLEQETEHAYTQTKALEKEIRRIEVGNDSAQ